MSYSPSSSSNSPSSSAVASWYCWYSDTVVHVRLRLRELHFIHTLPSVPMQEGLAAEHARELLRNTLEHLLNRRGVADEADRHLQALRRDVADATLHVVGNPLDEIG